MLGAFHKYKEEFFLGTVISLWLFVLILNGLFLLHIDVTTTMDQYFWFTLENPDGGRLSYPAFANLYFELLHQISGDNLIFFSQLAAAVSFVAFLTILLAFFWIGVPPKKILMLSLLFLPIFTLILLRIDIIAVSFALFAVLLFHRGNRLPAWLLLFAGALFKFFPVFFVPLFLAAELKNFNRATLIRLGIMGMLSILALFIFQDNISTLIFHSSRGIQIESTYANILFLINFVHPLGLEIDYVYGSEHLVLPPSLQFLVPLALVIQIAAVLLTSYFFYRNGAKTSQIYFYAFLVAIAMIVAIKVFSAQFIFWPLVFAIPVLSRLEGWKLPLLFFAIPFVSTIVFPLLWKPLIMMNPAAIFFLTIRNALLLFALFWFFKNLQKYQRKTEYK